MVCVLIQMHISLSTKIKRKWLICVLFTVFIIHKPPRLNVVVLRMNIKIHRFTGCSNFNMSDNRSICRNFKALSLILSGVEVDSFRFITRILILSFWRVHKRALTENIFALPFNINIKIMVWTTYYNIIYFDYHLIQF